MKLRHLKIENFRGIKSLELDFGDTTVLIGENNTGKTTILDALRFALREVRHRQGCAFDAYDFHLSNATSEPSTASPIRLQLTFREDNKGEWGDEQLGRLSRSGILQVNGECGVVVLEITGRFDLNTKEYAQDWQFLNLEGLALTNVLGSALSMLQNEVAYFYLPALRDATRHFDAKGSFWRPFLKESQLTPEKRGEIEGKLAEVNNLIVTSHESFAKVTTCLQDVCKVVPLASANAASIDAVPGRLFDLLAKAQVSLSTDTGVKVPVGRHGEGMQSLAVLMLFNAFLQTWSEGSPIIALEEPEAHLHPSAVRALWHLIEQIPGQKIISTHSGDLLAEVPPESVTRLYRNTGDITARRVIDAGLNPEEQRKFNFHIRQSRGELLFARCWILAEGETELTVLPEAARCMGRDLERAGVRCLQHTQAGIDIFIKVAQALGISLVGFFDGDTRGMTDYAKLALALQSCNHGDALVVMQEQNIEQHLCMHGFCDIYENLLTEQPRQKITVLPGNSNYAIQVADALPSKLKTQAAQEVAKAMHDGTHPVPDLLHRAIENAIRFAEES